MLRIGLTGGIGSGKSTVAGLFAQRGAPVIDADAIAHKLLEPGQSAYDEVVRTFGKEILDAEGRIDRDQLRTRVFDNPAERRRLESIVHPRVREEIKRQIEGLDAPYCIIVIPLLFEAGQQETVDRVLVVSADEAVRIKRVRERSRLNEDAIRKIIAAQMDEKQRIERADDLIRNDADPGALDRQVARLHASYLQAARTMKV